MGSKTAQIAWYGLCSSRTGWFWDGTSIGRRTEQGRKIKAGFKKYSIRQLLRDTGFAAPFNSLCKGKSQRLAISQKNPGSVHCKGRRLSSARATIEHTMLATVLFEVRRLVGRHSSAEASSTTGTGSLDRGSAKMASNHPSSRITLSLSDF